MGRCFGGTRLRRGTLLGPQAWGGGAEEGSGSPKITGNKLIRLQIHLCNSLVSLLLNLNKILENYLLL